MAEKVLRVEGMTCGHCKMTVEQALEALDGVSEAEVDLEAGSATVRYDESRVDTGAFSEAVEQAGYSVV